MAFLTLLDMEFLQGFPYRHLCVLLSKTENSTSYFLAILLSQDLDNDLHLSSLFSAKI